MPKTSERKARKLPQNISLECIRGTPAANAALITAGYGSQLNVTFVCPDERQKFPAVKLSDTEKGLLLTVIQFDSQVNLEHRIASSPIIFRTRYPFAPTSLT